MKERKTIIITGASRGIGAAIAWMAADKNYNVVVNYLQNIEAADEVVKKVQQKGGNAIAFQADVSIESEVKELFQRTIEIYGKIDALVNNAGILYNQKRMDEMDTERWQDMFNKNVLSCFLCCREAVKSMSYLYGGKGGSIVNVSSIAALTGSPNEYIDYAATKGAIDALTRGLSKEVAAEGIRVNGVRPGFIYTDIHASGGDPGRVDRIKTHIPMQRGGMPEEVAAAVLWLVSDEASFCTGTFIDVNGGK